MESSRKVRFGLFLIAPPDDFVTAVDSRLPDLLESPIYLLACDVTLQQFVPAVTIVYDTTMALSRPSSLSRLEQC